MINESRRCSVTALLRFGLDSRDKRSLLRQKLLAPRTFCVFVRIQLFDFHGYLFRFLYQGCSFKMLCLWSVEDNHYSPNKYSDN